MSMAFSDDPTRNRLLAALPADRYGRLLSDLQPVDLHRGQTLYEHGVRPEHVYFPTTGVVSLLFAAGKGVPTGLATIGNDGLVGIPVVLGGHATSHCAVVQSAGQAYRIAAETIRRKFEQGGELSSLALRHTQALMTQLAQNVMCNRRHTVDRQLCRWLLQSLDLLPGNQLDVTHELIARMLGVRREVVTEAAGKLQAAGLIRYSRGHVTVIDRQGLEARACECYSVVKHELERLLLLAPETGARARARPSAASRHAQVQARSALRGAPVETDAPRDRYADLYDFAPVAYLTLDARGSIIDLNLAAAILLGVRRSQRERPHFAAAVTPEDLPGFKRFLAETLKGTSKQTCEISLLPTGRRPQLRVRIEAISDEACAECRMVLIDVSAERQAERHSALEADRRSSGRTDRRRIHPPGAQANGDPARQIVPHGPSLER